MHRYLVTTALLMVFGTSAYMSVYGLAAVFTAHLPVVVCMGIGMELGKLLVVIHLHRRWLSMRFGGRIFYLSVAAALLMITSCEIMGFLAQSHTVTSRDLTASQATLSALDLEAELLNRQIEVTDTTLAGLPAGYVTRRIVEREKVGYGAARERLLAIARQRADLAADIVDKTAQAGPVFAVARLAGLDPARAATFFILVLVMVLEPLCIGLAVATSAAWLPASQDNTRLKLCWKKRRSLKAMASAGPSWTSSIRSISAQRRWPELPAAKNRWSSKPGWRDRRVCRPGCCEPCGDGQTTSRAWSW